MNKTKLLIVAHPDDESIFFGALVQKSPNDFHIICVTDGNADGRGQERKAELEAACAALGCDSFEMWDFPDVYEKRLDIARLKSRLNSYKTDSIKEVYTHNPLGEYGHPHHQDVCFATYQVFAESIILTPSHNNFPDKLVNLSQEEFKKKARILTEIYGKETQRFLNVVPITFVEGYTGIAKKEVESIYQYLTGNSQKLQLDSFQHMRDFIQTNLKHQKRLF